MRRTALRRPRLRIPAHVRQDRNVQLYLVRHGQTLLNALDRTQGWSDAPLTSAGESTARRVGANFAAADVTFDAVYAADMLRHGQTAALIVESLNDRISAGAPTALGRMPELREVGFGGYEGAENSAVCRRIAAHLGEQSETGLFARHTLAEYLDAIRDSNPVPDLPAEGFVEATTRLSFAVAQIARDAAPAHRVLVVTSGLSIMCILEVLGLGPLPPFIKNGAVTILEHDGARWTATVVADASYAEAGTE
jgi:broad specificity phosphatase PhoE